MHAATHHSRSPPARRLGPACAHHPLNRPERRALAAWVPHLRGGGGGAASVYRPRLTDPLALGPSRCASSSSVLTMPASRHADTGPPG